MKYYILILGFFILIPSVKSQSTYVNVDSLLSANPEIRSSILWTNRINTISYENWSPVMKQELQIAVDDLINSRTPFDLMVCHPLLRWILIVFLFLKAQPGNIT